MLKEINRTMHVCRLPEKAQEKIARYLMDMPETTIHGLNNMMDGRICDMEEVVSFSKILELIKEV